MHFQSVRHQFDSSGSFHLTTLPLSWCIFACSDCFFFLTACSLPNGIEHSHFIFDGDLHVQQFCKYLNKIQDDMICIGSFECNCTILFNVLHICQTKQNEELFNFFFFLKWTENWFKMYKIGKTWLRLGQSSVSHVVYLLSTRYKRKTRNWMKICHFYWITKCCDLEWFLAIKLTRSLNFWKPGRTIANLNIAMEKEPKLQTVGKVIDKRIHPIQICNMFLFNSEC